MRYIVESVTGDYDAQYGKRRVAFTVQGNPNKISGFFQRIPEVGDELEGDIVQKGQYWNFNFPKKSQSNGGMSDTQYQTILTELRAIRTEIQMIRGIASGKVIEYPEDPNATPENIDASF